MNTTSQPFPCSDDWIQRYAPQVVGVAEAIQRIKPGQRVFLGTGCAMPGVLVRGLAAARRQLADIEIVHLFTIGPAPYAARDLQDVFTVNTFFVADNVRELIREGLADYTPIQLADLPRLFASGQLPLDVALIQVSPPDADGVVSLGVSVDCVLAAIENANLVIAQVNPYMPRTMGDALIQVWDLDLLVNGPEPLVEFPMPPLDDAIRQIGQHVASLVEDGATLQIGIGRASQAVLPFLRERRDLGIHTELITDSILELLDSGCLTGVNKTFDPGQIVTSFCMGSRRLYEAVHDNPRFAFRRTEYVNEPLLITRQQRMVAINTALQVDLTGQVCVDSLGDRFMAGLGGIANFNEGARLALHGKSLIALPSTARNGKVSRIVDHLTPGAGVSLNRGCVQYVITEFGVAYLFGKSIQERAMALIAIAHPDHRVRLLKQAIKIKFLRAEMAEIEGRILVGPQELRTTLLLGDGIKINFRPAHPTDKKAIKATLYSLSESTIYKRFLIHLKRFPFQRIKNFLYIDHRRDVVVVGTIPEAYGDKIIAIGGYYLDPTTNRAEVAFVVRDDWQGRGLGTFMMRHLATVAKRNGLQGLTAETLRDNRSMQAVLAKCGLPVRTRVEEDLLRFEIDLWRPTEGE